MEKIKLTRGLKTQVDDRDFEWLNQWKWYALKDRQTYYAAREQRYSDGRFTVLMHRLILNTPKGMQTDHIDMDKLNNQRYNLRICTNQQNQMNRKVCQNTSSKYKGVHWHKRDNMWMSQIRLHGKTTHLGYFSNEIEAARAYDSACIKLHDKFARINTYNNKDN